MGSDLHLQIVGIAGTVISTILCLSPGPAYIKAWKSKDIYSISHSFVFIAHICNLLWLQYGLKTQLVDLIVSAGINTVVTLCFLFIYHIITKDLWRYIGKYLMVIISIVFVVQRYLGRMDLGIAAVVVNTLGYAAPMEQLKIVFAEKESRYMDGNVLSMQLVNSVVWSAYGVLAHDILIVLPNVIGFFFVLLQLIIYFWAKGWLPDYCCCAFHRLFANEEQDEENVPILKASENDKFEV